ncbi:MAG: alpha-1,4-glucan--maltose-1-phosphate maltosyltransferase [Jiangellales bacterium]
MTGRIPVLDVSPVVDCAAYPATSVVGEPFEVSAVVFREGHDAVRATAVLTGPDGTERSRVAMRPGAPGSDRWHATVAADGEGEWSLTVEGWADPWGTWRHTAEIKMPAGMDVDLVVAEGVAVLTTALSQVPEAATGDRAALTQAIDGLRDSGRADEVRLGAAVRAEVLEVLERFPVRELVTPAGPFPLVVERRRALYGSWYEFFPRSEGAKKNPDGSWQSGTFVTAAQRLPAVADMGFDVVYLPPIHPIGTAFRKGPNNTLNPGPNDPGVPWAIGAPEGGHDTVHPDLGTMDDFDAFVARARELGLEIALDLALQASPDHPWVQEHPEWFTVRPDGSIAYAENPPKKYQDIYPINFDNDPEGIYAEVLRIVHLWMDHGVRIFRVDNPHTKPVSFWHRLLTEIRSTDPDVIFLAEAFTRPAMMHTLGKVGFQQSYTYFTWRTGKEELEQYATELRNSAAWMRPNFFVNTPDILHASLQYGGPAMFKIRAVLASMLSPTWGVYAGYELYEHVALRPGSEEYLNSEKYQYRPRDWAAYAPGGPRERETLAPYLTRLNEIRRAHPSLQLLRNLRFHHTDDPDVLAFSKQSQSDEGDDTVIVVVNLDPHGPRETKVWLDMPALGFDWHETFSAHDEISGQTFRWGHGNFVRLDPGIEPAHVFSVRRWAW